MAYTQYTFDLGEYTAYEIKFVGRNGAKGEKRAKRDKATFSKATKPVKFKVK